MRRNLDSCAKHCLFFQAFPLPFHCLSSDVPLPFHGLSTDFPLPPGAEINPSSVSRYYDDDGLAALAIGETVILLTPPLHRY